MYKRQALARALAVEPKVLLLDEPFGALDAKVRKELRRWLRRLHDELHVTSVFVTHDQEAVSYTHLDVYKRQAQVRSRITPGDPEMSRILQVTDPTQQAVHMYKFMGNKNKYQAFKTAVSPWILLEAQ